MKFAILIGYAHPIRDVTSNLDKNLFGDAQVENDFKQGYFMSQRNDTMNYNQTKYVHVFPHSHTDLGWLNTLQENYSGKTEGKRQMYYKGSVQKMLTSVVENLEKDPKKTFTYAEMKFFKMWWKD